MQVARGTVQPDIDSRQPAQRGGDGRGVEIPHIGVGHQHEIRLQSLALIGQQLGEGRAAILLLAFQQHGEAHGQLAIHRQMGAAGFQEADDLTLIVHRPAADDALAARAVHQLRVERVGVPELQRVGGLHVVMAVEQHMRCVWPGGKILRDDARMALGLGKPGGEAHVLQRVARPFRGAAAILRMGRLGADAGDAQEGEEPLQRGGQGGIDGVQYLVHGAIRDTGAEKINVA